MEDKEWEVKWEKEKIEERAIKKAETDDFELEPCSIKHKREEIERKVKIAQKISRRKAKEEQKLVMVVGSKDDPYDMDEMLANIQGPKDDNQSKEKARKEANKGKKKGGRMRDPVLLKRKEISDEATLEANSLNKLMVDKECKETSLNTKFVEEAVQADEAYSRIEAAVLGEKLLEYGDATLKLPEHQDRSQKVFSEERLKSQEEKEYKHKKRQEAKVDEKTKNQEVKVDENMKSLDGKGDQKTKKHEVKVDE